MYKNQLQELAQRSCFNLPSYACIREGPDHAPRFKAVVNFNGESFESPHFCSTLRQAEHAAAEVALHSLSFRGPSHSLAARILDETGVYKNLLQEISQRVGAPLPHYTTFRSGLGHQPVFTGTVELAGITFTGEPAKNKKQAEKNAALAAWQSLKQLAQQAAGSSSEPENNTELEQVTIARALMNYRVKEKISSSPNPPLPFPQKLPTRNLRPSSPQHPRPRAPSSKILPLIFPKKTSPRVRPPIENSVPSSQPQVPETRAPWPKKFLGAGAVPYVPIRHSRAPCHSIAPPVTIRNAVPCYAAPQPAMRAAPPVRVAAPVCIRQAVPVYAAPPASKENPSGVEETPEPTPTKTPDQSNPSTGQEIKSSTVSGPVTRASPVRIAPPVSIRQAVPVHTVPPVSSRDPPGIPEPTKTLDQAEVSEVSDKLEQLRV